jgi:hypothetical protein
VSREAVEGSLVVVDDLAVSVLRFQLGGGRHRASGHHPCAAGRRPLALGRRRRPLLQLRPPEAKAPDASIIQNSSQRGKNVFDRWAHGGQGKPFFYR